MPGLGLIESHNITHIRPGRNRHSKLAGTHHQNKTNFESILNARSLLSSRHEPKLNRPCTLLPPHISFETASNIHSSIDVVAAYKNQARYLNEASDWKKYKDDQLLSNPGGDYYYLGQKKVVSQPKDQESFWGRIAKDVSDCFSNVKNFSKNLFSGAEKLYRDKNNRIRVARQRGALGSVVDFFKDLGSALSFGVWRPDEEKEPGGFVGRMGFFFSKIKEAVAGDLIQGVSGSVVHMGEDLVLAGWNLVETIPDATIGNFQEGQKLTTAIFDNGQVVIDYLTDILPTGEAWLRVHATSLKELKAPILYNLNMPEHYTGDVRWKHVRNTPLRKIIETIGSLLSDIVAVKFLGEMKSSSEKHPKRD